MYVVFSEDCLEHNPPFEYSCGEITAYGDSPARLTSIKNEIDKKPDQFYVVSANDYTLTPILNIHHDDYIQFLHSIHSDWAYTQNTWRSVYAAAQVTLTAAHKMMLLVDQDQKTVPATSSSAAATYALCRPPGHHAACQVAGGYCFINNVAVAARFLQDYTMVEMNAMCKPLQFDGRTSIVPSGPKPSNGVGKKKKVLIVDIDYHHYVYISLHGYPGYPYYTGSTDEIGTGPGKGYNINVTLDQDTTTGTTYLKALKTVLGKDSFASEFGADIVIVSLGLDTWHGNAGAGFKIFTDVDTYFEIGRLFRTIESCTGRAVLFVQEGGTKLDRLGCLATRLLEGYNLSS
ncbi:hypothetical protein BDB00DRAFT_878343 [Zychaea mexicana]|uniref:uncharacterized protein n=1 Tax=Zychaea mexicana TaxID=64656 RepID=UPI0022FEF0AC|nr:uncharacterized protein BDB00DRAFT_878343 [Zychaea mexicana]KAI9484854.1 hypothetical protein BDB00DRAFT_878343 [Zychaea mexicana]